MPLLLIKSAVFEPDSLRYGVNAGQYIDSDFKKTIKEGPPNSQGGHWISEDEATPGMPAGSLLWEAQFKSKIVQAAVVGDDKQQHMVRALGFGLATAAVAQLPGEVRLEKKLVELGCPEFAALVAAARATLPSRVGVGA